MINLQFLNKNRRITKVAAYLLNKDCNHHFRYPHNNLPIHPHTKPISTNNKTHQWRIERRAVHPDARIRRLIATAGRRCGIRRVATGGWREPRCVGAEGQPRGAVVLARADGLPGHRVRHHRPAVLAAARTRRRRSSRRHRSRSCRAHRCRRTARGCRGAAASATTAAATCRRGRRGRGGGWRQGARAQSAP